MNKVFFKYLIVLFSIQFFFITCEPRVHDNDAALAAAAINLKLNMRKLGVENVCWMRNMVLCTTDDIPGKEEIVKRILQNQDDVGNSLKPYFGEENARHLGELLQEQFFKITDLLKALKHGQKIDYNELDAYLNANADSIVKILILNNPNWKKEELLKMIKDYIQFTKEQASARLNKDYNGDIAAFDKAYNNALAIADLISSGIINNFPERFIKIPNDEKIKWLN